MGEEYADKVCKADPAQVGPGGQGPDRQGPVDSRDIRLPTATYCEVPNPEAQGQFIYVSILLFNHQYSSTGFIAISSYTLVLVIVKSVPLKTLMPIPIKIIIQINSQ